MKLDQRWWELLMVGTAGKRGLSNKATKIPSEGLTGQEKSYLVLCSIIACIINCQVFTVLVKNISCVTRKEKLWFIL